MLTQLIAGVLVIGFILYRQTTPRPVRQSPRAALILTAVGAYTAVQFVGDHQVAVADIGVLVVSTLIGLAIAAVRAQTVIVYRDPATGAPMSKGTTMTAVLWIVAIAAHFGIDALASSGIGSASLLLYIGLVFLTQNLAVAARARRTGVIDPAVPTPLRTAH